MDPSREIASLTQKLDECWVRRIDEANEWNTKVRNGDLKPSSARKVLWTIKAFSRLPKVTWNESYDSYFRSWANKEPSLAWALNDTLGWQFWASGMI